MTHSPRTCSRKTAARRRILAMQLLSLIASNAVTGSIDAAMPKQNPPTISSPALPKSNADFLGDDVAEDTASPQTSDDASSLLDQSLTPFALPDSAGLDAPSFNLATGLAASSLGTTQGSYSAAPAMMGDFFGGNFLFDSDPSLSVSLAGGDRRYKIAENVSPMPQDRVYFNYNHFHNALTDRTAEEHSLDRFTFGGERTFIDGLFSVDVRLPFSSALNSTVDESNFVPVATELGNLGFSLKALLLAGDTWLVSGGTTVVLPTGDDYRQLNSGFELRRIKNEAVHMAPFLGFLATPNDRWFWQGFVQADFDLNGNEVIEFGTSRGIIQDQNLLFVDISLGRWLSKRRMASGRTLGIAALGELHYTGTMNDPDLVAGLTNPFENMDILNATLGTHVQYGLASLRIGGAAPLRDDEEKLFDSELFVQASRAF